MFVSGQNAIYFRNVSGFGALLDEKPNSVAQTDGPPIDRGAVS